MKRIHQCEELLAKPELRGLFRHQRLQQNPRAAMLRDKKKKKTLLVLTLFLGKQPAQFR